MRYENAMKFLAGMIDKAVTEKEIDLSSLLTDLYTTAEQNITDISRAETMCTEVKEYMVKAKEYRDILADVYNEFEAAI